MREPSFCPGVGAVAATPSRPCCGASAGCRSACAEIRGGASCSASRGEAPDAAAAARRFLHFYGPATAKEFGAWGGLARVHAGRVWAPISDALIDVQIDGRRWLLREDEGPLASPPQARGGYPRRRRLRPASRPPVVKPDAALRKRLFCPVAGPGGVLQVGRLAGL